MKLVGYQKEYCDKLYNALVIEEHQKIFFCGCSGSGKSTIVAELMDYLRENWTVFHISGMGKECPPYYTWYVAAHDSLDKGQKRIGDISFGVNFQPIGVPVGFELNVGIETEQPFFNNNELTILKAIRKKSDGNKNILLIAEDFSSWDLASAEMLKKITLKTPNILGGKNIYVIYVDKTFSLKEKKSMDKTIIEILPQDISLEDISEIVNAQPFLKALAPRDLEKIIQFTGYDLRLINMAVLYQQEKPGANSIGSLQELLDKRISSIEESKEYVYQTLKHVSIINSLFSEKEAAYLLEQEPILAEKVLAEAEELKLIKKYKNYRAYVFFNKELKQYFVNKLDAEKKYLHFRFSQYLQLNYPEDYLSRAYHLYLSEHANDEKNILEAIYLLIIETTRRKELTEGSPEIIIDCSIAEMMDYLPLSVIPIVKGNISSFEAGVYQLNKGNYFEAISQFGEIHSMYSSKAFLVESKRLLLLAYIQLADDLKEIKKIADELYELIMANEFMEDELWCRTSLILIEVYGDRHVDGERFNELKKGFEKRVRKHMFKNAFQSLHAKYASKAALFFNSMLSAKLTGESCEYYRQCNSIPNLFLSLCNNAANLMICGEDELAKNNLQECRSLISENKEIYFPSTYKVENNIIINEFLYAEKDHINIEPLNKAGIISAAEMAIQKLKKVHGSQGHEVSHIIEFNLYSMSMVAGQLDKAAAILNHFKREYRGFDAFYKYYYHNATLAFNIINNDYINAQKDMEYLEEQEVLLLAGFDKILNKRNQLIQQLIDEEYSGNPFELNYELMKRGMRIQDPSSNYWRRIFLFSDLQFLSM